MNAFPVNISATGHWVDHLFWLGFWLTLGTFLIVLGILIYFVIRYRQRPGHKAFYTHGESPKARLLTFGLALLVFVAIDINLAVHDHWAWEAMWGEPPTPKEAYRVQVMAEQFAWNILYPGPDDTFGTPDDFSTLNELYAPVNKITIVQMDSKDVIHSFFLPNARIKQDAVPGMVTSLYFEPTKTGTYDIACAEHCGFGHYQMKGLLHVLPEEALQQQLAQARQDSGDTSWGWRWK